MAEPEMQKIHWILIAGTGSQAMTKAEAMMATAVGKELGRRGFGLITCGWQGVDKATTQAFAKELQALGAPLSPRLRQIVPRPDEPAFFGGEVIYVEKGVPEWVESVKRASAVILIGGVKGTHKTYLTAQSELVPVFPLPQTGGPAKQAFDDMLANNGENLFKRLDLEKLKSLDKPLSTHEAAEDLAETLCDLLCEELDGQKPQKAKTEAKPREAKTEKTAKDRADFLLVTALPEERDALLAHLPGAFKLPPRKDDIHIYFRADLPVENGRGSYRVVVLPLLGMGRVNAATATSEAIKRWKPRHVVLVGIAGGVKARNVALGDVLISEQIVDYELQKLTEKGVEVRWSVHKASRRLYAAALHLLGDAWRSHIQIPHPESLKSHIHFGPIASGDKVIAVESILSEYRSVWPSLIGVEMEAAGVASACFSAAKQPEFFMVRGVSDHADAQKNAATTAPYRAYAAEVAAAYTIELLRAQPIPFVKPRATEENPT